MIKFVLCVISIGIIFLAHCQESTIANNSRTRSIRPSGDRIRLRCPVVDGGETNITWFKNGKILRRLKSLTIYKNNTLDMKKLLRSDQGNYTCKSCRNSECSEYTQYLEIFDSETDPISLHTMENTTAVVGSTVNLICRFLSNEDVEIKWMRWSPNQLNFFETLEDPEVHKIENVTHTDEGWYLCTGSNILGNTGAAAYLTVVDSK